MRALVCRAKEFELELDSSAETLKGFKPSSNMMAFAFPEKPLSEMWRMPWKGARRKAGRLILKDSQCCGSAKKEEGLH